MIATTMFSISLFSSAIINVTIEIQRIYLFVCKRKEHGLGMKGSEVLRKLFVPKPKDMRLKKVL
jgi:hypothetical protein